MSGYRFIATKASLQFIVRLVSFRNPDVQVVFTEVPWVRQRSGSFGAANTLQIQIEKGSPHILSASISQLHPFKQGTKLMLSESDKQQLECLGFDPGSALGSGSFASVQSARLSHEKGSPDLAIKFINDDNRLSRVKREVDCLDRVEPV